MTDATAGAVFSLGAAFAWACALLLFRKGVDTVRPIALNLFKNVFALVLLVITMVVLQVPLFPSERTAKDWLTLLASGVLGLGVADTLFLAGLSRLGAARTAIVECTYSPSVIFCAWLYLGEPIHAGLLAGTGLVVLAVLTGALEAPAAHDEPTPRDVAIGAALGAGAMLVMGFGIVLAKPVLTVANPWWATSVRLAGGIVLPFCLGLAPKERADVRRAFTPGAVWRATLPAAFVGTYVSMILWISGMKYAATTVASVLNQTSTLFTLALATIFLREPLTGRRVLAIVLGASGALLATFSGGGPPG